MFNFSVTPGLTYQSTRIHRDVVMFPYTLDYMLESPNTTEFILISANSANSKQKLIERHIKKLIKSSSKDEVKFQEVAFN